MQTKIAPARVLTPVKKPTGIIVNTSALAAKQLDVTPAVSDSSTLLLRAAVLETKKKEADAAQKAAQKTAEKDFVTSLSDGSYFAQPTDPQPGEEREKTDPIVPSATEEPAPAAPVESEVPGAGASSGGAVQTLVQAMTNDPAISAGIQKANADVPLTTTEEETPKSKLDQIIDWLKADKIRLVAVMAAFGLVIYAIVKTVKK
ncbi:MAG: hypothetical protein IIV23_05580 [Ruminococcus sp.]|nr:hypothetical protein [Ruminococcus sp.]